mmetsp:Transcript_12831/g.29092  ORF Transcript_12831/g.29092 Transcript_12831/m.29092 type:complete len:501 (+) Transcript_12831:218-1720(+)|eukprot:CAMPEP_0197909318 /NCGR_PEP_ID=MMETSP1439-20131203/68642_1 /TAXON_ID=66791 /ORGANISM="Gonyaulax spinifera, Strain CCMP409" /LENGTH=500 /DNA_ID=CAMNT_0043530885 /DNA_START=218 /DNA_END=1720 /DNA_ORIENTATION=+
MKFGLEALLLTATLCSTAAFIDPDKSGPGPLSVKLRRQQIPLHAVGGMVHHKSAYYGSLSLGGPNSQVFDVVFDTGSGHLVVPSAICKAETCKKHRRYRRKASATAKDIDVDGTVVQPWHPRDQITVSFGTGEVTGIFIKDKVCLGDVESQEPAQQGSSMMQKGFQRMPIPNKTVVAEEDTVADHKDTQGQGSDGGSKAEAEVQPSLPSGCLDLRFVAALDMTDDPFSSFKFDGVVGLGLQSLSQTPEFNFVEAGARAGAWGADPFTRRIFSVYLAFSQEEESEITFGGWLPEHMHAGDSHAWCNAVDYQEGHWQLKVYGITAGGQKLDYCDDGTCRAVVDTGTSLLGVPTQLGPELIQNLRYVDKNPDSDCHNPGPRLEIDLGNFTLVLDPSNYARPEIVPEASALGLEQDVDSNRTSSATVPIKSDTDEGSKAEGTVGKSCVPMIMHIDLPQPLSPKTLILGEPVLQRYYTIFDTHAPRVGFAEAKHKFLHGEHVVTV